ncbi:MAG: Uma2 family endonuclease [Bacteroidia bacterium]|nr:Uma2 family endonuclease [Bacteroidia bacterium]
MIQDILKPILASPELPQLLATLQAEWEIEQQHRHSFWAEVDENRKAEFILGEIVYHSPVYGRHWMVSTRLIRYLIPYVYDHQLGKVAVEKAMIRLTRNDYEPDVCFWRTANAQHFEARQSAFPAPDFVVEILSDTTRERDRGIKLQDYALHGIEEYWIIDPEAATVEQYLLAGNTYYLAQKLATGTLHAAVITGFRIALEDLFKEDTSG